MNDEPIATGSVGGHYYSGNFYKGWNEAIKFPQVAGITHAPNIWYSPTATTATYSSAASILNK